MCCSCPPVREGLLTGRPVAPAWFVQPPVPACLRPPCVPSGAARGRPCRRRAPPPAWPGSAGGLRGHGPAAGGWKSINQSHLKLARVQEVQVEDGAVGLQQGIGKHAGELLPPTALHAPTRRPRGCPRYRRAFGPPPTPPPTHTHPPTHTTHTDAHAHAHAHAQAHAHTHAHAPPPPHTHTTPPHKHTHTHTHTTHPPTTTTTTPPPT